MKPSVFSTLVAFAALSFPLFASGAQPQNGGGYVKASAIEYKIVNVRPEANAKGEMVVINSKYLHTDDTLLVFTPAKHECAEEIPTVILLHGWSGSWRNWSAKYDLQSIADSTGFRIITPDGFYASWYLDDADASKMQYRKFFDNEFFPTIRSLYNLKPETTFITGLSMGGHGAINLFLDHIENYRAAGSMSGVLDLRDTKIKDLLVACGGDTTRLGAESAVDRVELHASTLLDTNKPMVITCGYYDYYVISSEKFSKKCRDLKIPHIEIYSPAPHSWKYWGFALQMHLTLFRRILNGENLGY